MSEQVFHEHLTIMRIKYALFWPDFRPFSTVILLELCQSLFRLLGRFSLNTSFLFETVLITGGA